MDELKNRGYLVTDRALCLPLDGKTGTLQVVIDDQRDLQLARDLLQRQPRAGGTYKLKCSIYVTAEDKLYDAGLRGLDAIPAALSLFDDVVVRWDGEEVEEVSYTDFDQRKKR